jgi:hypothetical protein
MCDHDSRVHGSLLDCGNRIKPSADACSRVTLVQGPAAMISRRRLDVEDVDCGSCNHSKDWIRALSSTMAPREVLEFADLRGSAYTGGW